MRTAGSFWWACIFVLVSTMKVIKVFFLFILLGRDYGLELASLEAFPTQAYGVDGRLTFCLHPFLLSRPCFTDGTVFLAVTVFLLGNACNKNCLSYGNHRGKDMAFWRTFIKQCHVLSLVQLELRSMIKDSGLYAVYGVYHITQSGVEAASGSEPFMLPIVTIMVRCKHILELHPTHMQTVNEKD